MRYSAICKYTQQEQMIERCTGDDGCRSIITVKCVVMMPSSPILMCYETLVFCTAVR